MKRPLNLSPADRAYCDEMRMLTTDEAGAEVFVGLSRQETDWYRAYLANEMALGDVRDFMRSMDGTDRYEELRDRHERARLIILSAENEARHDPVRH